MVQRVLEKFLGDSKPPCPQLLAPIIVIVFVSRFYLNTAYQAI